ncbi:uncharacterized protein LOC128554530 [Mercenaria mercenaria]|uniref:uncharacterized protein LOC128554530 n=1 Tax=Mercenaria mercenaria TaxID=6596 RepID=UPI00234E4BBD|nr:uncharacterized protein LOC128554530 [Mercenaria mercenaria]
MADRRQNESRKGQGLRSAQDQEEEIQKGINSKDSAELLQNLQRSLQSHCEVIMYFTKALTAQKGASKDVVLKDNTHEMFQAKPVKLWTSFNEICCNIQTISEHYGFNPSHLNIQQLLEMVEKYKLEDKVQIQVMHDKSGDVARKVENELTVRLQCRMGVKFKTCRMFGD